MLCGRWTWESGEKKSVIDYMLFGKGLDVIKVVVEDSGNLDIGSDHNLIWNEVVWGRTEIEARREWYKWGVDGRLGWEHYQEAVEEEFIGWKKEVRVMLQGMNLVMRSESCLLDWKRSLLVPLHKDGDNEEVGNYREIALGGSMAKVFMRVLARKVY